MNIFEKVNELELSNNDYVVVAGGVLVALDLLEWDDDIDICVTPELFAIFRAKGWPQEEWAGKPVLRHSVYDVGVGFGDWSLKELQADAMIINGIPFMSLQKLLQWKRAMGRPKDVPHIKLIEGHLRSQKKRKHAY